MSIKLTCRQVEEFLLDYLEGQVSLWTKIKFRYHMHICDDCRKFLEDYRNAVALGQRIFNHPDDDAANNVPERILEVIVKARKSS